MSQSQTANKSEGSVNETSQRPIAGSLRSNPEALEAQSSPNGAGAMQSPSSPEPPRSPEPHGREQRGSSPNPSTQQEDRSPAGQGGGSAGRRQGIPAEHRERAVPDSSPAARTMPDLRAAALVAKARASKPRGSPVLQQSNLIDTRAATEMIEAAAERAKAAETKRAELEMQNAALREDLASSIARAEGMAKYIESFSPDEFKMAEEMRVALERQQALETELAELRRQLNLATPGFHEPGLPWSPRLHTSVSGAILHPRGSKASGQKEAGGDLPGLEETSSISVHMQKLTSPITASKSTSDVSCVPGTIRRAREAEARWAAKRAQIEHERTSGMEATMRSFATIRYTGGACAEMHSLYDPAERPQTTGAASSPPRISEEQTMEGLPLPPRKAKASAKQRPSGAGRVAVITAGSPGAGLAYVDQAIKLQRSPPVARSPGSTLMRVDSGLRSTASLPQL
jgi:hypothetical protein